MGKSGEIKFSRTRREEGDDPHEGIKVISHCTNYQVKLIVLDREDLDLCLTTWSLSLTIYYRCVCVCKKRCSELSSYFWTM